MTEPRSDNEVRRDADELTRQGGALTAGREQAAISHHVMAQWIAIGVLFLVAGSAFYLQIRNTNDVTARNRERSIAARVEATAAQVDALKARRRTTVVVKCLTKPTRLEVLGCLKVQPGAPGQPGSPGVAGTPGVPGLAGKNGLPGLVGAKGDAGPVGPQGLEGASGVQGPPGEAGKDGKDGRDGQQGQRGEPGAPGLDGAQGPPGPQGAPGADGPVGPVGPAGPAGPPGPAILSFSFVDSAGVTHICTDPEGDLIYTCT